MQGTLNEIDFRSILQLIELGQRTGELFIETFGGAKNRESSANQESLFGSELVSPSRLENPEGWFVFFVSGRVVYAADRRHGQMKRLRDYLRRYSVVDQLKFFNNSAIATTNNPEYAYLWLLLEKNILNPSQARIIIKCLVQETLFELLNLHQGTFVFELGNALDPPMTAFEIGPLITEVTKQVQEWKHFHPHIQSPDQVMVITDQPKLKSILSETLYQRLVFWANGKTSLRQLARYLHRDLATVARGIYPYIEKGLLQVRNPVSAIAKPSQALSPWDTFPSFRPPQIVCIDDDITIGKQVEFMVSRRGYQITLITDPLQAFSQLFQFPPDLILCDITMPRIDGYEICAMLRHATLFRQVPIIMLTGKDAFMDRVRARMVGATDYLTKPFGEGELLLLLEKYLNLP